MQGTQHCGGQFFSVACCCFAIFRVARGQKKGVTVGDKQRQKQERTKDKEGENERKNAHTLNQPRALANKVKERKYITHPASQQTPVRL